MKPEGGKDMAEANDVYGSIYQNLIDAGCSRQSIRQYMELVHEKNILELLKQLSKHRKHLLDQVHVHQKEIDCLDYLIYSLEKQK